MVAPIQRKMPSFSTVSAGATATIDLPTTGMYHQVLLVYSTATAGGANQANMEAEITAIRIVVNGVVQRVMSAAQLFLINAYRGVGVTSGLLPIFFAPPFARAAQGEDSLAWGMADVDTFQIEVDVAAGATTPTLTAWAIKDEATVAMNAIVKWKRFTVNVTATGIVELTSLPKSDAYYTIHNFSADISDIEVTLDGKKWFETTLAVETEFAAQNGFTVQATHYPIDFMYRGRVSDALPMKNPGANGAAKEFRIDYNMSAATSFTLLTETLGFRD